MATKTVLVVEDDAEISRLLGDILRDEDYRVVHAASGEAALAGLPSTAPDLVLLDLALPGMNGSDLVDPLRQYGCRSVPIILLSALSHVEQQAEKLDVQGYVAKPFDIATLLATVRRWLGTPLAAQATT